MTFKDQLEFKAKQKKKTQKVIMYELHNLRKEFKSAIITSSHSLEKISLLNLRKNIIQR